MADIFCEHDNQIFPTILFVNISTSAKSLSHCSANVFSVRNLVLENLENLNMKATRIRRHFDFFPLPFT